jgi:hypothetical protein
MGAPTSAILAEIFIQCLEHTKIINILNVYQIIAYHRYVDDILIMYDTYHKHNEHFNGIQLSTSTNKINRRKKHIMN